MSLTEREWTVLLLRQEGLTQSAVARKLHVTQAAVSCFERKAYRKLQDANDTLAFAAKQQIRLAPGARR